MRKNLTPLLNDSSFSSHLVKSDPSTFNQTMVIASAVVDLIRYWRGEANEVLVEEIKALTTPTETDHPDLIARFEHLEVQYKKTLRRNRLLSGKASLAEMSGLLADNTGLLNSLARTLGYETDLNHEEISSLSQLIIEREKLAKQRKSKTSADSSDEAVTGLARLFEDKEIESTQACVIDTSPHVAFKERQLTASSPTYESLLYRSGGGHPISWATTDNTPISLRYTFSADFYQVHKDDLLFNIFSGMEGIISPSPISVQELGGYSLDRWGEVAQIDFEASEASQAQIGIFEVTRYLGEIPPAPDGSVRKTGGREVSRYSLLNHNLYVLSSASVLHDRELTESELPEKRETYMHEVGHALGLQHPNDYPDDPSYDKSTTIMSYNVPPGGYPATPMIYDVKAIQHRYGVNLAHNNGATIYTLHHNKGVEVTNTCDAASGVLNCESTAMTYPDGLMTIWDAGGIDTIKVSELSGGTSHIDLREGFDSDYLQYSSYTGSGKKVYIAYNAHIENAEGGPGDDTLIGNKLNNKLNGKSGRNTYKFYFPFGNDIIVDAGTGQGKIYFEDKHLVGTAYPDPTRLASYRLKANDLSVILSRIDPSKNIPSPLGTDLLIELEGLSSHSVLIKDFLNTRFGINLKTSVDKYNAVLTGRVIEAALLTNEGVYASKLPGQIGGPADVYRQLLLSAETARRFGARYANSGLVDSEDEALFSSAETAMRAHNHRLGVAIGLHVRAKKGKWADVVSLSQELLAKSLSSISPSQLATASMNWRLNSAGNLVLTNSYSLANGQLSLSGISLLPSSTWHANPLFSAKEDNSYSTAIEDCNWPDLDGGWLSRFQLSDAFEYPAIAAVDTDIFVAQDREARPLAPIRFKFLSDSSTSMARRLGESEATSEARLKMNFIHSAGTSTRPELVVSELARITESLPVELQKVIRNMPLEGDDGDIYSLSMGSARISGYSYSTGLNHSSFFLHNYWQEAQLAPFIEQYDDVPLFLINANQSRPYLVGSDGSDFFEFFDRNYIYDPSVGGSQPLAKPRKTIVDCRGGNDTVAYLSSYDPLHIDLTPGVGAFSVPPPGSNRFANHDLLLGCENIILSCQPNYLTGSPHVGSSLPVHERKVSFTATPAPDHYSLFSSDLTQYTIIESGVGHSCNEYQYNGNHFFNTLDMDGKLIAGNLKKVTNRPAGTTFTLESDYGIFEVRRTNESGLLDPVGVDLHIKPVNHPYVVSIIKNFHNKMFDLYHRTAIKPIDTRIEFGSYSDFDPSSAWLKPQFIKLASDNICILKKSRTSTLGRIIKPNGELVASFTLVDPVPHNTFPSVILLADGNMAFWHSEGRKVVPVISPKGEFVREINVDARNVAALNLTKIITRHAMRLSDTEIVLFSENANNARHNILVAEMNNNRFNLTDSLPGYAGDQGTYHLPDNSIITFSSTFGCSVYDSENMCLEAWRGFNVYNFKRITRGQWLRQYFNSYYTVPVGLPYERQMVMLADGYRYIVVERYAEIINKGGYIYELYRPSFKSWIFDSRFEGRLEGAYEWSAAAMGNPDSQTPSTNADAFKLVPLPGNRILMLWFEGDSGNRCSIHRGQILTDHFKPLGDTFELDFGACWPEVYYHAAFYTSENRALRTTISSDDGKYFLDNWYLLDIEKLINPSPNLLSTSSTGQALTVSSGDFTMADQAVIIFQPTAGSSLSLRAFNPSFHTIDARTFGLTSHAEISVERQRTIPVRRLQSNGTFNSTVIYTNQIFNFPGNQTITVINSEFVPLEVIQLVDVPSPSFTPTVTATALPTPEALSASSSTLVNGSSTGLATSSVSPSESAPHTSSVTHSILSSTSASATHSALPSDLTTPSPLSTGTPSATEVSASNSAAASALVTHTATATSTHTATPKVTATVTPAPSVTPTPTLSPASTVSPALTVSPTLTSIPSASLINTAENSTANRTSITSMTPTATGSYNSTTETKESVQGDSTISLSILALGVGAGIGSIVGAAIITLCLLYVCSSQFRHRVQGCGRRALPRVEPTPAEPAPAESSPPAPATKADNTTEAISDDQVAVAVSADSTAPATETAMSAQATAAVTEANNSTPVTSPSAETAASAVETELRTEENIEPRTSMRLSAAAASAGLFSSVSVINPLASSALPASNPAAEEDALPTPEFAIISA